MAQVPGFFYDGALAANSVITLDGDTAKHIWQVLRMEADDKVILTDGKGAIAEGSIHTAERHKCNVTIEKLSVLPRREHVLHLGICFTKNNSRNEWLLEKATELGVASIIPIASSRSEKTYIRNERWQKILQSAILQSKQYYLPDFSEIRPLHHILKQYEAIPQKLVAHCIEHTERTPLAEMLKPTGAVIILIGPEGDFTQDEVNLCVEHGYKAVSMGRQRLRTETAAITAAAYFNVMNDGE